MKSRFDTYTLEKKHTWLITGVAGFIGSHLLEYLLSRNQKVIGIDNLSSGSQKNLDEVKSAVDPSQWSGFHFLQENYLALDKYQKYFSEVDFILHHAASASVPESIKNPTLYHQNNVDGFFNLLNALKDSVVKRLVYASSSAVYGDHVDLPKKEDHVGNPQSPYAVTKKINEIYAQTFSNIYGFETIGLRYFNVFGPRQDPHGPYAAVIPKWIDALIDHENVEIYGDGTTSRDFCYVGDVVQANIRAALSDNSDSISQVFNVAGGESTTLTELFEVLVDVLGTRLDHKGLKPVYKDFREGDVMHSCADIMKAKKTLGFEPHYNLKSGLLNSIEWYLNREKILSGTFPVHNKKVESTRQVNTDFSPN